MHSISKYINGHSDVIGGVAIINDDTLAERLRFLQNGAGRDFLAVVMMSF
jgi:cystathionine beta-lyase/cystathionine gamma-synthase